MKRQKPTRDKATSRLGSTAYEVEVDRQRENRRAEIVQRCGGGRRIIRKRIGGE